jgi:hypothetical protein
MLTQVEIKAYVEAMRCAEKNTSVASSGQCNELRERQLVCPRYSWVQVAEWYREHEERTGTLLGCD